MADAKKNGAFRTPASGIDRPDNAYSAGRSRLKRISGGGDDGSVDEDNNSAAINYGFKRPPSTTRYGSGTEAASSSGIAPPPPGKRSTSVPRQKQAPPRGYLGTGKSSALPSASRMKRSSSGTGTAGAVDEDTFANAFDEVPRMQLYSAKELQNHMQQIRDVLSDPNNDWEKRIDALKKIRSLVLAGAVQYDEFYAELKTLELPMQSAVKDLRSQVVREACITIAHLTENLGIKFDRFAEAVLPPLINLIQNSAKIMATSGFVACKFILKNTFAPKLIPIISSLMASKSREIRRACAEFVGQICYTWPTHALERNVTSLQESIRQALSDPDPDARQAARKAYWGFRDHFKDQADALFLSLDAAKQRQLRGELSQSSSNNSIGGLPTGPLRTSQENLRGGQLPIYRTPGRSTSDIDTTAQRRARGGYVAAQAAARASRTPSVATAATPHNMNSLPRPSQKTPRHVYGTVASASKMISGAGDASARTTRTPSKSISQPGSRSSSPGSRLPTSAAGVARKYRPAPGAVASGLPIRSHGGSREHSPSRVRRYSIEENGHNATSGTGRYITHETDIGALLTHRRPTASDNFDMESETSSVCSERSLTAAANRQAHFENWELSEALKNCQSTQWAERKDGLIYLQSMFKGRRPYSASELKRVCDTFSRLFVDTHNKTFSMFMDTLVEFLAAYRHELFDWLYVLLTRLLTKKGTDLLASVQTKLTKTLDVVRESFPYQLQFATLIRYISDPANTPSLKMKVAVLNYLNDLACVMDSSHLSNSSDVRQAVSKIVGWTAEPKSAEVRRASQNVLVTLFSLNAGEFTAILNTFSKSYQDSVYRLLQSQLAKPATPGSASAKKIGGSSIPGPFGHSANVDLDSVHDSLKKTSEEIQQYSLSGLQKVIGSQDSGIVDAVDSFQKNDNDILNGRLFMEQLCINTDEERQQEIIAEILTELSNHNRRTAERRKAMSTLKYMTRDGSFTLWDEHFKTILLILLETLGDDDPEIRSLALRVLGEICLSQSARFRDYAELTVLKVLDAHKDDDKDVVRAADECASILATRLPPHVCLRILNPVIKSDESRAALAAIKILTKVLERMSPTEVEAVLADVVPGVVKGFENQTESVIRKASVVCLVALHHAVGAETLEPFLSLLNNSKMKLLHLYIKRTETQSASPTSQI